MKILLKFVEEENSIFLYSNIRMENKWTDEQIIEWVTIITIFLFACFPYEMIELSETSLGKLFFISIVVYYSMVDPIYGIIACCIVIAYYQLDLYKSIIAIHRDTLLSENMVEMRESFSTEEQSTPTPELPVVESYVNGESSIYAYTPFAEPKDFHESELMKGSRKKELLNYFRKTNCDEKGKLKYKGGIVQTEMADHVFREIQFPNNSAKCNPCDESCEFSIVEERLTREEEMRPVSSNDEPIDWNKFFGHYIVTPITSIVDDIYAFEHRISEFIGVV
jgi:hypothetical protein